MGATIATSTEPDMAVMNCRTRSPMGTKAMTNTPPQRVARVTSAMTSTTASAPASSHQDSRACSFHSSPVAPPARAPTTTWLFSGR